VPYTPFLDGRPDQLEGWYEPFLVALARNGRLTLAAATAQIHRRVAYAHIARNRALSEEVDAAKAHYRSNLEFGLAFQFHTTGNVLAGFGALKAEVPEKYIEENVIMSVNVGTEVPAELGAELLAKMLGAATPATQAMLQGASGPVFPGCDDSK
jgi:hypothetical protein